MSSSTKYTQSPFYKKQGSKYNFFADNKDNEESNNKEQYFSYRNKFKKESFEDDQTQFKNKNNNYNNTEQQNKNYFKQNSNSQKNFNKKQFYEPSSTKYSQIPKTNNFFSNNENQQQNYQRQSNSNPGFKLSFKSALKDHVKSDLPFQSKFEEVIPDGFQQIRKVKQVEINALQSFEFTKLKNQGNDIYKSIDTKKNSLKLIQSQLNSAQQYYSCALQKVQTCEETAAVQKNLAVINFKLVQVSESFNESVDYLNAGITKINLAIQNMLQSPERQQQWFTKLVDIQNEAVRYIINKILNEYDKDNSFKQAWNKFQSIAFSIKPSLNIDVHLLLKKKQYEIMEEEIVELKKNKLYTDAERLQINLNESLAQVFNLSKQSKNEKIRYFFNHRYQNRELIGEEYQAWKYLALGNQIYKRIQNYKIRQSSFKIEECNEIWESVDAFKSVIKLFEGKFIHFEAESYYMLAIIYQEILGKKNEKTRDFVRTSIELHNQQSQSQQNNWYLQATNLMRQIQSEADLSESEAFEEWKTKNKSIVQDIQTYYNKGIPDFVQWLLKTHLPSDKLDYKHNQKFYENNQKLLKKTMLLYHGDKVIGESIHFKYIAKLIMLKLTDLLEKIKCQQTTSTN